VGVTSEHVERVDDVNQLKNAVSCSPLKPVKSLRKSSAKNCLVYKNQGPRNLYGKDGKFRATFKSGTEKRRLSVTFDDLMSSN